MHGMWSQYTWWKVYIDDSAPIQYINTQFQIDSYAMPLVELVEEAVKKYSVSSNSVVNFGCATGLTSFLLSTAFQKVQVQNYI